MAPGLLTPLHTGECQWLARGELRDIYQHPRFPEALVKVVRADRADAAGQVVSWEGPKLFPRRQYGIYLTCLREFRETLRVACRLHGRPEIELPFTRALGLVRTERGLGLVVEKAAAPDGSLAPTVRALLRTGQFTPRHRHLIDRFFDHCILHHFVFGDIHAGNLVFLDDPAAPRILCVDGIGDKTLLPLHQLSRQLNALKLRRKQRRLHATIAKYGA